MNLRKQDYFIILFSTLIVYFFDIHLVECAAPNGCTYNERQAVCDFTQWNPPLSDSDFGPKEFHGLTVEKVNGVIPTEAFSGLNAPSTRRETTYIELDCALNDINLELNLFTSNLDWIESLHIKTCYIQSGLLSQIFENLTGLARLEIGGGGIVGGVHTDSLEGLADLTDLIINADFRDNIVPDGFLSPISKVENIDLKSSGLTNITENAFSGLVKLQTLILSYNLLIYLPQELFKSLSDLQTVDLSENSLTTLPQGLFASTVALTSLTVSENSISSLPSTLFNSLVLLQSLDLSGNSLTTLPVGLLDFQELLETLDVSRNSLEYVPEGLFDVLVALRTLDLSDNSLTTLPENMFHPLLSLTSLSLSGNLWNCSCSLFWLSTWSLYTGISASLDCSTPDVYNTTILNRAVMSLNCTSVTITYETTEISTTPASKTSSSSSTSTLSLRQIVTIAASGTAILMSSATILGMCIAYNKLKKRVNPEYYRSEMGSGVTKGHSPRRLFASSTIHTPVHTTVEPYYDVHYKHKF